MKHPECRDRRTPDEIEAGEPQVNVRLINILETGLQIRAYAWAKDPSAGFELKCEVLRNIKKRFDETGIGFAHPYRMVIVPELYKSAVSQPPVSKT